MCPFFTLKDGDVSDTQQSRSPETSGGAEGPRGGGPAITLTCAQGFRVTVDVPVEHVPVHPLHVDAVPLIGHVRVLHVELPVQPQPELGSMAPIAPQNAALVVLPSEQRVRLVAAE